MLIGKSVNSLGYFEENGAQNACFTISNESLSTQQNNRKYNGFNEIKHSCDSFDITTKKKIHIFSVWSGPLVFPFRSEML